MAGATAVVDVELGPAELLAPAVAPHPHRVVVRAMPVGILLDLHQDGEVIEAKLDVDPPEPLERPDEATWRFRFPDGSESPRAVTNADPRRGIDDELVAGHPNGTAPRAHLREAR